MKADGRRWICRVLFITLAVIPTLVVSVWAGWAHTHRAQQQMRHAWHSRIVREFGLVGRAQSIEEGPRGDVIFGELELLDPETEKKLASIRRAHAAPAGKRGWVVEASYCELASDQLLRLWQPIYDRLRHSRGEPDWSGLITANHVTLCGEQHSHTLSHVECQFGSNRSASCAKMEFLVAGLPMVRRAELVIARDRSSYAPQTFVVLNTGAEPLPCSLAYSALPALSHLGSDCRFQGQLKLRMSDDQGWRGEELSGQLGPIDFATLVTELFPHHLLIGNGTLQIRRAIFDQGRLVAAEGELHSGGGRLSRSVLEGASEHLGWNIADTVRDSSNARVEYAELHFEFRLDDSGLSVRGKCGEPGVILLGKDGPLAWESGEVAPVTNFLSLLVPDSTHHVPATRQTAWLNAVLPVPTVEPPETALRPESPPLRMQKQR